jgi:hypothetical protein
MERLSNHQRLLADAIRVPVFLHPTQGDRDRDETANLPLGQEPGFRERGVFRALLDAVGDRDERRFDALSRTADVRKSWMFFTPAHATAPGGLSISLSRSTLFSHDEKPLTQFNKPFII